MFRTGGLYTAALSLAVGLCGCNSARLVTVSGQGGVVAIPNNSNCWPMYHRDKAIALIEHQCPQGYVIDREEEVAVGTLTTEHQEADTSSITAVLLKKQNTVMESRPVSEWHIVFHGK
jgi:hypothetical protein